MEYKSLNIVSGIFFWVGWLMIAVAIIISMAAFSESGFMAVLIGLGIVIGGIFSIAFSELIKLFIRIEYNTRKDSGFTINPDCKPL